MTDGRINEIRNLLPQAMLADWVRIGSRLVRLLRDERHPEKHGPVLDRLLAQAKSSVALRAERNGSVPVITYPPDLPITGKHDQILSAIRENQVVIVVGETGSGKTTQIPKMCLEAGLGIEAKIGCTQPRRVAALSISRRVAEELNTEPGNAVGCKIRFDDRSGARTYIKFMTDGILLAETQGDPLLTEYNAIIIDEAHERSLNIDFLLGYLKGLLAKRPELKLIVTSATIEASAFSRAFNNAPIVEVSGRLYPVEVRYEPFGDDADESTDATYTEAAVSAAAQVCDSSSSGDVLIFLPSERDIRETSDQLRTLLQDHAEIIPLFGRLSSADQTRVFAPSQRRKIVVATNIAETSLTIPGIRYVIDSGLARISRYNPRSRTKRLPIESIAQSSANQRKGRAGRVEAGICIRLYSESEFAARPPFAQPEIQRANLAEVILRMKAFRLGEIESFPFIDPPTPAAIHSGYALLQELGALSDNRELTELGQRLARLPIDPTLGRMLLQSQTEHATRELLIIASGLSIQDPRERPLEQKDAAAAAHKQFVDTRSDFLTLLNIWTAVHDKWDELRTQSQRRKFCRTQFLSYVRLREWQDLHAQLHDALEELGTVRLNESNAAFEAVHKSVLAGLLGHVAQRTERNQYKGVSGKQVVIFPGSVLYERTPTKEPGAKQRRHEHGRPKPASQQPTWIVAGELVETSQLFARTLAGVSPEWILELAPHLCRTEHRNPQWQPRAGQVMVTEIVFFYGLEIRNRQVAHGNVNPKEATEIFIRSALIEEALESEPEDRRDESTLSQSQLLAKATPRAPAVRYAFIAHNHKLRQKIEMLRTRLRRHDLPDLDEALFAFYRGKLETVSSFNELNRILRGQDPQFLFASEEELAPGANFDSEREAFPDTLEVNGQRVPVSYAYRPGEELDGATLRLSPALALDTPGAKLEWGIPGLREGQVSELLRGLPKTLRRELMPFQPKVAEICRELQPGAGSLAEALSRFIRSRYGIEIPPATWDFESLPTHLRPRLEVVSEGDKTVATGRDFAELRQALTKRAEIPNEPAGEHPAWAVIAQKSEKFGITSWTLGDVPEKVLVYTAPAGPVYGWPGLKAEEGHVNLRIFRSQTEASQAALPGLQRLVELVLQKELAWLQKDLRSLARFDVLTAGWLSGDELQAAAFQHLRRYILPNTAMPRLASTLFAEITTAARQRLPGLAAQFAERLAPILELRAELLRRYPVGRPPNKKLNAFEQLGDRQAPSVNWLVHAELNGYLPKHFLETLSYEQLPHMVRYLKALMLRAERAALNPAKDQERAQKVRPYIEGLQRLVTVSSNPQHRPLLQRLRWMIEEFKVSLFAQELGTAFPISAKRLDEQLHELSFVLASKGQTL